MKNAIFFVIVVIVVSVDGRVYYLENLDGSRNNDATFYPIVEPQASRDLDLSFSAGDPVENENAVSSIKKVRVHSSKPRSRFKTA